jgi:hypothetical protein
MLPKKSSHGVRLIPGIARFSPKFPLRARSLGLLRIACAVILICAAATPELRADDTQTPGQCKALVHAPLPKGSQSLADRTKAALAQEWIVPNGAEQLLKALKLLTAGSDLPSQPHSKSPNEVNLEVLADLTKADPKDEQLYRAAMGDLGRDGEPLDPPPVSLLDALAKANNLTKPDDDDGKSLYKTNLFGCTQKLIDSLSPPHLVQINYSFAANNGQSYVALYQLLQAYPTDENPDADVPSYLYALEVMRAAFEDDTPRLAKKIAAKISATKK